MTATDTRQQAQPRYCGIPTFMRVPMAHSPSEVDIALAGVPFDGGVSARPGARHGPREMRNQSTMVRGIHPTLGINPFAVCRVGDIGDVPFHNVYDLEAAHGENRTLQA